MRIALSLMALSLFAQAPYATRSDLNDKEVLELLGMTRQLLELQDKANTATRAAEAFNVSMQKKFDDIRKAHKAEGCHLDTGMRWTNCPITTDKKK